MYHIGIDVGGTNTDAVLLKTKEVIGFTKQPTTPDVTTGISNALNKVFESASIPRDQVTHVSIGTTHFINAVLQRRGLARVSVIRICGPASQALPPFAVFPDDLARCIEAPYLLADGGFNFDRKVISAFNPDQISSFVREQLASGLRHFAVIGVFSAVDAIQEEEVERIILNTSPDCEVTLSSTVGDLGFIERENATILNESLRPLCDRIVAAFEESLKCAGLDCDIFVTQNDGTLLDIEQCLQFPIKTFSSGATNSMRGAAHLTGLKDALIVDIGGTSSDAGLLINRFPKPSSTRVTIGGVDTNFMMPDVTSIALGGGSIVRFSDGGEASVGPLSVALNLTNEALVFGGSTLTTTDVAVACGRLDIGDRSKVKNLNRDQIIRVNNEVIRMLEGLVDHVRVSKEVIPVVVVGGGSVIVPADVKEICGLPLVHIGEYSGVANALGAALSEISATFNSIVDLGNRKEEHERAKDLVIAEACRRGAEPGTVSIAEVTEIALPYLPGTRGRLLMKAIGQISLEKMKTLSRTERAPIHSVECETLEFKCEPQPQLECEKKVVGDSGAVFMKDGLWKLSEHDVICIATGAGVLGCGGGGSPTLGRRMLLHAMKQSGRCPEIASLERMMKLHPDGSALIAAMMGSPTIQIEKILSIKELSAPLKAIRKVNAVQDQQFLTDDELDRIPDNMEIVALLCGEIGGSNSIYPLLTSLYSGISVLDFDGMGRAFPELQMVYPFIQGMKPCPSVLCDAFGGSIFRREGLDSPKDLENFFRIECLNRGCSNGIAMLPIKLTEIPSLMVAKSYSRAWKIGDAILRARKQKEDPIKAVCEVVNGKELLSGKVVDVSRRIEGGWAKGCIQIRTDGNFVYEIDLQNEFLVLRSISDGIKCIASVPDLITVLDKDTGEPIMTEELRYGLRVCVLVIPAPPELTSSQALKVVGPAAFGYTDIEYKPCGVYKVVDAMI